MSVRRQVRSYVVPVRDIVASEEFARGLDEVRKGLPFNPDNDSWDYERGRSALDRLTTQLRTALRRETKNIIEIGKLLIEVRKHLQHGEWQPWLAENFDLSIRTAQNYFEAAEYVARKRANRQPLPISATWRRACSTGWRRATTPTRNRRLRSWPRPARAASMRMRRRLSATRSRRRLMTTMPMTAAATTRPRPRKKTQKLPRS